MLTNNGDNYLPDKDTIAITMYLNLMVIWVIATHFFRINCSFLILQDYQNKYSHNHKSEILNLSTSKARRSARYQCHLESKRVK